ncbi:hypothetical protein [Legionella brunensis]|uniref:Protein SidG n=1 Tax=Legionella brunensis TaxID=29422 RepID=A0A0W0SSG2_9GAMM|nr:hypothetical protein [Legionella brunensis]KTC86312.1 protein SidG [Legionella brunensis]
MPKYNPSIHNVEVLTWGTKNKTSNGMDNFVEQELFGGNVGHASIVMSLPINEETKKWIETYCYEETFEEYARKGFEEDVKEYEEDIEGYEEAREVLYEEYEEYKEYLEEDEEEEERDIDREKEREGLTFKKYLQKKGKSTLEQYENYREILYERYEKHKDTLEDDERDGVLGRQSFDF